MLCLQIIFGCFINSCSFFLLQARGKTHFNSGRFLIIFQKKVLTCALFAILFCIQRKPKISASRKLMLKVNPKYRIFLPNCNVMSANCHMMASVVIS